MADGFLAAPDQTARLQHRYSLDPSALSNLSLSDAAIPATFVNTKTKEPKPRHVSLLPRTHPLQPHSIRCHSCSRIIYAGETFTC